MATIAPGLGQAITMASFTNLVTDNRDPPQSSTTMRPHGQRPFPVAHPRRQHRVGREIPVSDHRGLLKKFMRGPQPLPGVKALAMKVAVQQLAIPLRLPGAARDCREAGML